MIARFDRLLFVISVATSFAGDSALAAVSVDLVTVGNPLNVSDTTGYGAVSYPFQIGKYEVTIGQYCAFLNAVAKADTYGLYNTSMATDLNSAGISRANAPGLYSYSVITASGSSPYGGVSNANRPIAYVSWFDAARFANWMANGQPTGAQSNTTTERGAYNLNGLTSGSAVARNAINPNTNYAPTFFIPTENEWYKAAYFNPALNSGSGGYYAYATQSNVMPGNVIGGAANQANYSPAGTYSVTQSTAGPSATQNYLSDVGAFAGSGSFYGTFDQSGNVEEWNDLDGVAGNRRGLRGAGWSVWNPAALSTTVRDTWDPSGDNTLFGGFGFRVAAPVPEPRGELLAAAGLGVAALMAARRQQPT